MKTVWLTFAAVLGALAGGCGDGVGNAAAPTLVFGRGGNAPGEFNYPRAAAAHSKRIYVVDKSARVQCFDLRGRYQLEWSLPEFSAGKPVGLAVAPDGRVFVPDTHYARVLVYDADGRELTRFGTSGRGDGQFLLPTDVAFDSHGNIYVGEYGGNDRISKFTPGLEYLFSFGGPDGGDAKLARPQGLLMGPDDTLWVADACQHRICRFDSAGHLLSTFGHEGRRQGEFRFPYGIDMLSDGTLVVAEYGNNRVQRLSASGESLGTWGTAGREPGQLAAPWGVAVLPGDDILIVDSANNRAQVIAGRRQRTWSMPDQTGESDPNLSAPAAPSDP